MAGANVPGPQAHRLVAQDKTIRVQINANAGSENPPHWVNADYYVAYRGGGRPGRIVYFELDGEAEPRAVATFDLTDRSL